MLNQRTAQSAWSPTTGLAPGEYAWRVRRLDVDGKLGRPALAEGSPGVTRSAGPANSTILFFLCGGASHVDTWDPKPALRKYEGQALPGLNGVALPSQSTKKR